MDVSIMSLLAGAVFVLVVPWIIYILVARLFAAVA